MRTAAISLVILTLCAAPAFAENNQFGFLLGGSKRIADLPGDQGQPNVNDFKFSNSVKEAFYGVSLDPSTVFKIKLGQITGPIAFATGSGDQRQVVDVAKGDTDHIDAIVDYRFPEAFGSSGIFAGIGMYRQSAAGQSQQTQFGLSGGINADFPLSRRYGVIVEGTYHWLHTDVRQRYVTLTGGLRISY